MNSSNFLRLNIGDIIKGFTVAIIFALLSSTYQILASGHILFVWSFWQPIIFNALAAGISYLIKNVFTNSDGQLLKSEQVKK